MRSLRAKLINPTVKDTERAFFKGLKMAGNFSKEVNL